MKSTSLKIFKIYGGYEIRSLDFNEDYAVISGCRVYAPWPVDYRVIPFNDECGLQVFALNLTESKKGVEYGMAGGVSD